MLDEQLVILAITIGILTLSSVIGQVLALRQQRATGAVSPGIDNLNARIDAWWVMVGLIAAALFFGQAGITLLFAFASFTALREFLTLTHTTRADHVALLAAFFIVVPGQYWLVMHGSYGLFMVFIPVWATLCLPVFPALRGETSRFLDRIAQTQWGLLICVFCLSHIPALGKLELMDSAANPLSLVLFLLIVAEASDVLQYVCGKLMGRRKLAPRLSPGKTVEGFVGGVGLSVLLGAALSPITPFSPLVAAAMALAICLAGVLGGFVMSAIKRDRGVKDWGYMITGHGGMLDRVDSLIFSAPIFFHLTRFWYVS